VSDTRDEMNRDGTYTLPDLPYDPGALEPYILGRVMELHHGKHHAAYVKGANTALDQLQAMQAKKDFTVLSKLERDLAFNVSGHVLHSVFWTNLCPGGSDPPDGLTRVLSNTFGSTSAFRDLMTEAAATIQGSGWALASWEPVARRIVLQQVHDHQGNHGQGTVPLLAIDAWEHAYYLQYENDKAAFFHAIWNVVNWRDVARRLTEAREAEVVPREFLAPKSIEFDE
jgi:Fe-Mn family superoxide dismutase